MYSMASLPYGERIDVGLTDTDSSVSLVFDCVFKIPKAVTTGELILYKRSMILRTSGIEPISYGARTVIDHTEVTTALALGLSPGDSLLIPGGLESFGIINNLADGGGGVDITDFTFALRVVNTPVSPDGR